LKDGNKKGSVFQIYIYGIKVVVDIREM